MQIELIESKRDGGFVVEIIHDGGEVSRVLFMGANDETMAIEYFTRMRVAYINAGLLA